MKTLTSPRTSSALLLCILGGLACCLPAHAAKETFERTKPHLSVFVEAADVDLRGFRSIDGLGIETEVIEFREGGDNTVRKLPGLKKFSDVTLKRGYFGATDVEDWARATSTGQDIRKNITVTILNRAARTVRVYHLVDCFPIAWKLSNEDSDDVLVEELTIVVERIERVQ